MDRITPINGQVALEIGYNGLVSESKAQMPFIDTFLVDLLDGHVKGKVDLTTDHQSLLGSATLLESNRLVELKKPLVVALFVAFHCSRRVRHDELDVEFVLFEGPLVISHLIKPRHVLRLWLPFVVQWIVVELEVATLDVAHALTEELVARHQRYTESLIQRLITEPLTKFVR